MSCTRAGIVQRFCESSLSNGIVLTDMCCLRLERRVWLGGGLEVVEGAGSALERNVNWPYRNVPGGPHFFFSLIAFCQLHQS